jgi:hypothetical protein
MFAATPRAADGDDHDTGRLAMSRKTRVPIVAACALGCILLQACSLIGSHFVTPGSTVHQISASPDQIVLEYTHDYDTELPAAKQVAEDHCGESGKHATLVSNVQWSIDHSRATFRCD